MKVISGYLGRDLLIEGDIHSKETIRIDGQHRGTLISQQEVTLGVSAEVEGEIHAPVIRVSGSFKGTLHASKLVELLGEARVKGDLVTPPGGLSIDKGGFFEGKFIPDLSKSANHPESTTSKNQTGETEVPGAGGKLGEAEVSDV